MKKFSIIIFLLAICFAGCKKEQQEAPINSDDYKNLDLAITYNRYEKGILYETDTIQNEFKITNLSEKTIKAGDTLKLACELNDLKFNLDLTSSDPSGIVLERDLAPHQSYVYNPGYLLGDQMLAYFGNDTLTISVLLYGVNNTTIDDAFSNDPHPENNKATLKYTLEGIRITK